MERFTWDNFTLISFYLLLCFLCNLSVLAASSLQLMSNNPTDENNLACAAVNCGQGTCKALNNTAFVCECNPGWRAIQIGPLIFPSCVVPNCSIDFQCDNSSSQPPTPPLFNFNCLLVWCGDGTCISNTSGTGYTCQCPQGSENLFGNPTFACLKSCSLGVDCNGLGLDLPGSTPPPPNNSGSTPKTGAPSATPASPPPPPPNNSGSTNDTGTPVAPPPPSKLGSTVESGPGPASNCARNLRALTMVLLAATILAWF